MEIEHGETSPWPEVRGTGFQVWIYHHFPGIFPQFILILDFPNCKPGLLCHALLMSQGDGKYQAE